jgi:hypothetical protein
MWRLRADRQRYDQGFMVEYLADRDIPRALNASQRAAPHFRKALTASGGCRKTPVVKSYKIEQWRATADEDGHYCFAVAL